MPYFETIDQTLPLGLKFKDKWYNVATIREWIASDSQIVTATENKGNVVKATTAFLAATILQFKNTETNETLDKVTIDVVRDMYIADRDMCLLAGRKLTYGNELPISFKCRNGDCRQLVQFECNLDAIDTVFNEEFPPHLTHPVELDKGVEFNNQSFNTIILQPLRGREQEQISALAKTNQGKAATQTIYCAVADIPGLDMSIKNPRLIETLRARDVQTLMRAFGDMQMGPKLVQDVICGNCETSYQIPLVEMILSVLG